jgi:hypothetical protein
MDQKNFVTPLHDAVDLIRMLEHVTENCRGTPGVDVPWGGIALTLGQTRHLLSNVLSSLSAVQPIVESEEVGGEVSPAGSVRELTDDPYYEGTFDRIQLPREQSNEH